MIAVKSISQRYSKKLLCRGTPHVTALRGKKDQKADCDPKQPTDCDWRKTEGLSGSECHDPEVKSVMDYLWNNHRPYFPLLKPCFRRVKRPDSYKPGNDPNANNFL